MGLALLRLARKREDTRVVASVSRNAPDPWWTEGAPWFAPQDLEATPEFDVAVDFSLPDALGGILALCQLRGAALVSGTTGLDTGQQAALQEAATRIPVCHAANFSLGVAVLAELVERAATSLADWDCDIIESHHVRKLDAPSGTALALGRRAEQGGAKPRYASIRAGDIVGEHNVQFTAAGERIELIHRASDRDIFARGALHVASKIAGRQPGQYRVADLL